MLTQREWLQLKTALEASASVPIVGMFGDGRETVHVIPRQNVIALVETFVENEAPVKRSQTWEAWEDGQPYWRCDCATGNRHGVSATGKVDNCCRECGLWLPEAAIPLWTPKSCPAHPNPDLAPPLRKRP